MVKSDFGLVSIIIPTWNRSELIIRTIESVLNQTYENFELLICDDGSSDGTKDLVLNINDKRIIWVPGKHTGLPAIARNNGIKVAKGEWIAFLDSDDMWAKNKLEIQMLAMFENSSKVSCTNGRIINGNEKLHRINNNLIGFLEMLNNNLVTCSSVIISKNLLLKTGFFCEKEELKAAEDYELWLRVMLYEKFLYVDDCLVYYNDDPNSSIRSLAKSEWKLRISVFKEYNNWFDEKSKQFLWCRRTIIRYFGKRYYRLSIISSRNIFLIEKIFLKLFYYVI